MRKFFLRIIFGFLILLTVSLIISNIYFAFTNMDDPDKFFVSNILLIINFITLGKLIKIRFLLK